MPLYEYRCRTCGHCFEELIIPGLEEDEAPACPACTSTDTERQLSAFSAHTSGPDSSLGSFSPGASCGSGGSGGFT